VLADFFGRLSIRVRLTLVVGLLLTTTTLAVGAVAVAWTKATLIDQVDDRLLGARADAPGPGTLPTSEVDPTGRPVAVLHFSSDGELKMARPSGTTENPDPLPALSRFPTTSVEPGTRIRTVASVEGTPQYRYLAVARPDGGTMVFASPLTAAATVVDRVETVTALAGGLAVLLGSGVGWLLLGRGLQPIDQLATTATKVADGDFKLRSRHLPTTTEIGRLTAAFNYMMSRVDQSFASQLSARSELEAFIADASHELRTPLATIRGYAELHARGGTTTPREVDHAMAKISAQSRHMSSLVEDLLVLAHLDNDRQTGATTTEVVDFVRVVDEAVASHRLLDPSRRLTVDLCEEAAVAGDPTRLSQVVKNLLANVRMHTPATAPLQVVTRVTGAWIELVVADSGPGIGADFRTQVFRRFYRVDSGRPRPQGGSGLGLSIVAAAVEAHGGSITIEDTPGGGVTFIVRLPLASRS
jgi:two-component system, OmpR family, sensor kinase